MSPKTLARTTGAFYLLVLLGGIVAQGVVANGLVVPRDAAATATNILSQPRLYALGYTVFLIEMAAQMAISQPSCRVSSASSRWSVVSGGWRTCIPRLGRRSSTI